MNMSLDRSLDCSFDRPRRSPRLWALCLTAAAAVAVAGCAGDSGPSWTYAPLGPSEAPGSGGPAASGGASPAGSPGGSPAGSGAPASGAPASGAPASGAPASGAASGAPSSGAPASGAGATFDVSTPADQPLAFVPAQLDLPAGTAVTVNYLNDSPVPHNIHFFAGPDQTGESLGATEQVTGPGALESVTFTTPQEPGDYFFWCDVHLQGMTGTYTVAQ